MAERELNRSERAAIRKLVTELCANYDSQDKICLPLDSPCYMLNKWWTGAYCRYFEKAVLPVDAALESAITGEDTSMRQKIWRLQTHEVYGGTWLSDFVPNYLGGFIETPEALADKPDCPLIGADGNIFNLLGIASRTLREHGLKEQAKEMSDRVFVSGSYGEALCIIGEYVNITDSELEHKNSLRQQLKATKPADPVKKQQTSKQQER